MKKQKLILNKEQANQKLQMALEIAEQLSEDNANLYLIGVAKKRGCYFRIYFPIFTTLLFKKNGIAFC